MVNYKALIARLILILTIGSFVSWVSWGTYCAFQPWKWPPTHSKYIALGVLQGLGVFLMGLIILAAVVYTIYRAGLWVKSNLEEPVFESGDDSPEAF